MDKTDNQESITITFEWVLRGLKHLFESSKGESKSKVTKSAKFGAGRWQILFYANSGTENGTYISLYLSCEPTAEEKDKVLDGKWIREGVYKFSFELRSLTKTVSLNLKEAQNHTFSSKTANWGWAQFTRRDSVYYNSYTVKEADAFVIICTISSSPQTPVQPPSVPVRLVPREYLERVGALLDDPLYSDVEFILPKRGRTGRTRTIYANRKILERADYFQSMFRSGFSEASMDDDIARSLNDNTDAAELESPYPSHEYDDSDDEEDDLFSYISDQPSLDGVTGTESGFSTPTHVEPSAAEFLADQKGLVESARPPDEDTEDVNPKPPRSCSPKSKEAPPPTPSRSTISPEKPLVPGPKKMRAVVQDVAYSTYKAVLYYIYTDFIVFAPLSSSFTAAASREGQAAIVPAQGAPESQSSLVDSQKVSVHTENPTTRREWTKRWQQNHPSLPAPCSAKAVYRLADKLGLLELRERAYEHIQKSLNVENIPYEVFSSFSATFPDIRKVQVNFFLEHWAEVRASDAMGSVWQQIRNGKHPGFEEIWPFIAKNLVFNPSADVVEEGGGG